MPKDTGKKLADMLYGQNPEQAAFGVFPQMKGRRSKQDPEAAKNVPIDLLRGFAAGALGAPSDLANIPGMIYEGVTGNEPYKLPYGSEHWQETLPGKPTSAVGRAASELGALGGGFYTGPAAPIRAVGAIPKAIKRASQDFGMAAAQSGPNVIKPKGGNWLTGNVENAIANLKSPTTAGETPAQRIPRHEELLRDPSLPPESRAVVELHLNAEKKRAALDKWVESNLTNYIKNQMATPDDPVRKLAEQGITHKSDLDAYRRTPGRTLTERREAAGFPAEGLGQSELARVWENLADYSFMSKPAKDVSAERYPWVSKLDPETPVYGGIKKDTSTELAFDHILDVLREDLASGRIRPEQLNKVSMEQAVRRTYEYDQELAAKMAQARAAQREGLPVYKEYPEGYRWIELNKPGAFASESEAMGHSVRGYEPPQGHPDWSEASGDRGSLGYGHGGWEGIKSGNAKVYSLVDPKGNPHVTVEVGRQRPRKFYDLPEEVQDEISDAAYDAIRTVDDPKIWNQDGSRSYYGDEKFDEIRESLMRDWLKQNSSSLPQEITQIKGKQNRAPADEYLPFVQDFVKGGQWSDVGDFQNTGLIRRGNVFTPTEKQGLIDLGQDVPEYLTQDDIARLRRARGDLPPEEGMAHGGGVHISDNPDVMQLELAGGGLVSKLAKLARAPAKTKQEIEAIAERIAPQVTGEYIRKKPGSAVTVADKTKKQFEREKSLPVDIRATAEERIPEPVDIEKLKGEVMIGIPGDPTVAGKTLYGVGDVRLESPAPQHGGPLYGLYHDDDHFWASGLGAARRVQNLAKEAGEQYDAPVIGKYIMMGPESINYAQHFADANLQAIDLSKMTKKQIEGFNKIIRQGSPASGPRPSFPGIEDKESAYLHMAMDPELRKHFNALMQQNTVTEAFNLPSGQDIRYAITEGPLRDLETGVTGYSMGRMRPDIPSSELKLSEHPTYSHDIPGEFLGQSKYPIPYELSFPDTLKSIRENPKQAGHEFGSLKMVGPRQTIDQQLIDELKMYEERMKALTGKAAGGEVHGLSNEDMLYLQSQEDLAKMPPHAQREYITNMGGQELRQRMATKMAEGGEITADDLILEERKL